MHSKDITSKQLLKRMAADLANLLLKLDIDPDSVELLETQHQRVEERRADLVVRALRRSETEPGILHIEIQNSNDPDMPLRMLRYYTDIRLQHRSGALHQYLIYIGKQALNIADIWNDAKLNYGYHTSSTCAPSIAACCWHKIPPMPWSWPSSAISNNARCRKW
ncbi:MAG: hypothetical protein R3E93_06260 [Thiothrix sp.]